MKKIDLTEVSERNREKIEGIIKIIGDALELYGVEGVSDISLKAPKLKFDVHIDEVYALLQKFVGPSIIFMNEDFAESGDHTFYISDKEAIIKLWKEINDKNSSRVKINLENTQITFDDKTSQLHVGDCVVKFPLNKNEHYVLEKMYNHHKKDESVDWEEIYKSVTGSESESASKESIQKDKRKVGDLIRSINKKVKDGCGTDTNLLLRNNNTVARLY